MSFFLSLLLALIFTAELPAQEEDPVLPKSANLLSVGPNPLIGGCVNPATGDLILSELDIVLHGPQALPVRRTYCSGSDELSSQLSGNLKNYPLQFAPMWNWNHTTLLMRQAYWGNGFIADDSSGGVHVFKGAKNAAKPLLLGSAWSNVCDDEISAQSNPRNEILDDHQALIYRNGAGATRHFNLQGCSAGKDKGKLWCSEEKMRIYPNGNRLSYEHANPYYMRQVTSNNRDGSKAYASIRQTENYRFETSDGRKLFYKVGNDGIEEASVTGKPTTAYKYKRFMHLIHHRHISNPRLDCVEGKESHPYLTDRISPPGPKGNCNDSTLPA
jgi:hypothetical protein